MQTVTIPILPCPSIDETLAFYEALGFSVTYRQAKPNTYACIRYENIELNFFVKKDWNPSFCYIRVENVEVLHGAFVAGLKRAYGRRFIRGTPRITSVNDLASDRRFNVIDPGGNWLYIGRPYSPEELAKRKVRHEPSRLEKALTGARLLAYSKGDALAAALYLDKARAGADHAPVTLRVQALVLRADIAVMLGQNEVAEKLSVEARQLELSDDERLTLGNTFEQLLDLEQTLAQNHS